MRVVLLLVTLLTCAVAQAEDWRPERFGAYCSNIQAPALRHLCRGDCDRLSLQGAEADLKYLCRDDCPYIRDQSLRLLCQDRCIYLPRDSVAGALCRGDCRAFDRNSDDFHLCMVRFRYRALRWHPRLYPREEETLRDAFPEYDERYGR